MPRRTILIVDRELGFVFWLGQTLDAVGYDAFPAKDIVDARKLLGELNIEIDLLIVNSSLAGAAEFTDAVRRSQGHLKVIAVSGEGDDPSSAAFPGADASQPKPNLTDQAVEIEWLQTIQRVLQPNTKSVAQ